MNSKENFKKFLTISYGKSLKTISNYISALNTVSRDLSKLMGYNINIYEEFSVEKITEFKSIFLSNKELKEKNLRGKRMYSSALIAYIKFLSNTTFNIDTTLPANINYCPKPRGNFKLDSGKKQWSRDPNIITKVIYNAKFLCEYSPEHIYFVSQRTSQNYVEGHHLVPMKYQEIFQNSLDTEANVISLCPVCHKLLHYGIIEEKIKILTKLYKLRCDVLKLTGIDIDLDTLISFYK